MGKHAYLIIAHKADFTFRTLLHLLDDKRNDIFIHMDKKTTNYSPEETERLVHYAKIFHTPKRIRVQWGGHSMVDAELLLIETAINSGYHDYYHLLSGEDLPIKTQNTIHSFFSEHQGKEFVHFQSDVFSSQERVQYYHVFRNVVGRDDSPLQYRNHQIPEFQQHHNIIRNKNISFQKGAQWFSITDAFAKYVVSKKSWIRKVFRYTHCADEIFLQTLLINSVYKDRLYYTKFDDDHCAVCRLIDWTRGQPYIFRYSDFEEIKNSPNLFARKFNCEIDKEIIEYVATKLAAPKQETGL